MWHGTLQELRLSAGAVCRHHQSSRDRVRGSRTEIPPHDLDHEVDTGRTAGGREQAIMVAVERGVIDLDFRIATAQLIGIAPMGGCSAAIQKAGCRQHKSPRADRGKSRPTRMCVAQSLAKLPGNRGIGTLPPRHHDDVGLIDQIRRTVCHQRQATMRPQRTIIDRTTGKPIPACAHLRASETEYLGDDPELERAQAVIEQRNDQGA